MSLIRTAVRAARDPRRTLDQGRLALDLLQTGARDGPVLRPIASPPGAPRLLVVSLSEWPFQLKLEVFLAKALEQRGFEPVFATLRGGRWAERYLRAVTEPA